MSSVDGNTIPQQTLNIATRGIVASEICFADTACRIRNDVTTLSGEAPILSSTSTVRRDENRDLAPGAESKPLDFSMGKVKYNCLAQPGHFFIPDEHAHNLKAYGIEATAELIREARKQSNLSVDLKLEDALYSIALNTVFDVTTEGNGSWDDGGISSTPYSDIEEAAANSPDSNLIIFGRKVRAALSRHPDTLARLSNYNGGFASAGEVETVLQRLLDNPDLRVLYFNTFYNTSPEGLGFTPGYCFENGFWLGHQDGLQLFDPKGDINNRSENERIISRRGVVGTHTRYVDLVRPHKETGIIFEKAVSGA